MIFIPPSSPKISIDAIYDIITPALIPAVDNRPILKNVGQQIFDGQEVNCLSVGVFDAFYTHMRIEAYKKSTSEGVASSSDIRYVCPIFPYRGAAVIYTGAP